MNIDGIKLHLGNFEGMRGVGDASPANPAAQAKESFGEVFADAIREVNELQKSADSQIEGLALGQEGVTPHGAMLALEKADVAFQLMSNIRAKILRAYEEVIRTTV